ncbi:MAG: glucosaminidase domain-containing protein [Pseudanabaena sp.]
MKTILTAFLLCVCFNSKEQITEINYKDETLDVTPLSKEDSIKLVLFRYDLDTNIVKLLVAQAKHESGNFKNKLTKYNNVFARHYSKFDTLALGPGAEAEGHNNFAKYKSIEDATISQYLYLKRKKYSFKWETPYQYAVELKSKKYYTASIKDYSTSLTKYYNITNGFFSTTP